MMDWPAQRLMCELQLAETVRDVKFLHNHLMFAVAQKDSVFIYDQSGIELHCLKHHSVPFFLDFLPYHFLLVAIGRDNVLRYQDTSTGARVVDHKVKKLGPAQCMRQNPKNAVITLGHQRGLVSMWTPNMADPVVKLLAHPGPVLSLCFDHSNANTMITCGADRTVKIWDLRTYKSLAEKKLQSPCESVDASMTGLIAFGRGNNVQVWNSSDIISSESEFLKNPLVQTRYLSDKVSRVRFCPYEDVLGVSRQNGYSSVLVPGAGEVNYDSGEINPFETKKQRQEREVKELLEKLRPEMITLDEGKSIGAVGDAAMFAEAGSEILNGASKLAPLKKLRRKQRGRNSSHKRFMRSKLSQSSKSSSESRKLSNRADSELLKSAALSRFI
jgi:U3 small nucleolar RNA-associated protein 7